MFRDEHNDKPDVRYLGAGSIVRAGRLKFLIVMDGRGCVNLVNFDTFAVSGRQVTVDNPYHLTREEAATLMAENELTSQHTFTDFEFDAAGLKTPAGPITR